MPDTATSPIRVALDMTSLLGELSGVGQMVQAIAENLAGDPTIDLHGFAVSRRAGARLRTVAPTPSTTSTVPVPAKVAHKLWQHVAWPSVSGYDVVHGPNFVVPPGGGAVEVLTLHDMTAWRWPDLVTASSRQYPALVKQAIKRGAVIHTVSDFIADEVRSEFGLGPDRVRRIYNGVPAPGAADATAGRALAGGGDYLLAVGTIEPRKDYPTLINAFAEIRRLYPDLRLVLAGANGWGADKVTDSIRQHGLEDAVIRLGYVSDADRRNLMAGTECLVYPSIYEGFGLPPLEAMSYGVPVVATRAGAVPEVVGDAALLVPVGDVDELARTVVDVLSNSELNLTLRAGGPQRVIDYEWRRNHNELTAWYRELIG